LDKNAMKKIIRISILILLLIFVIPVGAFVFFGTQAYYQTRNMRHLAKQIEKTGWQDYSYNIYSNSVTLGYYKGEVWGPDGTYLNLGTMFLDDRLEENYFDQINDIRVCTNGFVKFVDFVESQTGKVNLTFKDALIWMDEAYIQYNAQLELGHSPQLPRDLFNEENQEMDIVKSSDCKSISGVKIPEKLEKSIRYP